MCMCIIKDWYCWGESGCAVSYVTWKGSSGWAGLPSQTIPWEGVALLIFRRASSASDASGGLGTSTAGIILCDQFPFCSFLFYFLFQTLFIFISMSISISTSSISTVQRFFLSCWNIDIFTVGFFPLFIISLIVFSYSADKKQSVEYYCHDQRGKHKRRSTFKVPED